jgi:hypothetical protein
MDYWFCTGCKGAAIVEDPSLFSCSMGSMLEWMSSTSLSDGYPNWSLHLSMAQTFFFEPGSVSPHSYALCTEILRPTAIQPGVAECTACGSCYSDQSCIHAMEKAGKVGRPCGAVVCGPSKNSSGLVASTVDKDLRRIIPAPYHPRIEPFQSLEKDISVKWLTQ